MGHHPDQMKFETPTPLIYIVSQLSTLEGDGRADMKRLCRIAADAARETAKFASPPWELDVYCPIEESAPWIADGRSAQDVYETNFGKVTQEADGLIVIGRWGGSFGAGQELAWATHLRLPILFLRWGDETLSRQVEGTPADLEIVRFDTDEDLAGLVGTFLNQRRTSLETHAKHRKGRTLEVAELAEELREKYVALDQSGQDEVPAISHMHPRRVHALVNNPQTLISASLDELLALSGALNVELGRALDANPLPDLTREELAALRTASAEWDWSGQKTLSLMQAARLERAKGGTRRLRMSTPQDWRRFAQQTRL